jgi:hypothetical protein
MESTTKGNAKQLLSRPELKLQSNSGISKIGPQQHYLVACEEIMTVAQKLIGWFLSKVFQKNI